MIQKHRAGQTTLETVVLLPLALAMIFALIQIGHVGLGIAIVNYAVSSAARQAVTQNQFSEAAAEQKFKSLLMAGVKFIEIRGTPNPDGTDEIGTMNLRVTACAQLDSYPMVGPFLAKALRPGTEALPGACSAAQKWFGPVGLDPGGRHFIIQGQTVVRMNYNTKG